MATITSLGIGSGLDLASLLEQLQAGEEKRLEPITDQQKANSVKISAFGEVTSLLTALQDSLDKLSTSAAFGEKTVSFSGSGLSAIVDATATAGNFTVETLALAKAHTVTANAVTDKTAAISGSGTLSLSVGGASVDINIAEGATLEQIRDSINVSGADVSASIVNVGGANPYRLSIISNETGTESAITQSFSESTGGDLTALMGSIATTSEAQDALVNVNGVQVSSQSNTIEDAMPGVTFTVTGVGSEQSMKVADDTETTKANVMAFVDAYNAYAKIANTYTAYNTDSDSAGYLLGDTTMRSIQSRLNGALTTPTGSGSIALLNNLGIKLTETGLLEVDDKKLTAALTTTPEALQTFFLGDGVTDGFAAMMDDTLDDIVGFEGLLENTTNGLNRTADDLVDAYDKQMTSIEATVARYRTQFSAMDALVAQMNNTSAYLTQQFDAMNKDS